MPRQSVSLDAIANSQLADGLRQIIAHGAVREIELRGDLACGQAFACQAQGLAFAVVERIGLRPGLQRQLRWAYEDYEVVIAGDRESAIAAMRAHRPAVVTLDLGLPPDADGATEGFATLEEILLMAPHTKVIVASGHGARDSARRAIALGDWAALAAQVRALTAQRGSMSASGSGNAAR